MENDGHRRGGGGPGAAVAVARSAAMLVAVLALTGCAREGGTAAHDEPAGEPTENGSVEGGAVEDEPMDEPLEVTVSTGSRTRPAGEPVELTLVARNPSAAPARLEFASSQRYDFRIEEASGRTIWTWSAGRAFAQMLGSETVEAGGERRWTEIAPVELQPGDYTAVGTLTNRGGPVTDRVEFSVR